MTQIDRLVKSILQDLDAPPPTTPELAHFFELIGADGTSMSVYTLHSSLKPCRCSSVQSKWPEPQDSGHALSRHRLVASTQRP